MEEQSICAQNEHVIELSWSNQYAFKAETEQIDRNDSKRFQ